MLLRAIIELLVRRPVVVVLGVALILLGGLTSYRQMPVDLFPDLDYPLINVITQYPGGTAEDIETLITRPIEGALQGLPNVQRLRSVSTAGVSRVTIEFTWGTEVLSARQLVISALGQVGDLPAGAQPELENIGTSLAMISTYTVSGGAPIELRDWAEYEVAPALTSIAGVARVHIMGGARSALLVELDPVRLQRYRISAEAVVAAIRAGNSATTGGFIESHGRDVLIEGRGQIQRPEDLTSVIVARTGDGLPVLLGDVARIRRGALPERYAITADQVPALAFLIEKQAGASALDVSRAVDDRLSQMTPPSGAHVEKFYDQAEIIGSAYRNMRNQLLIGAALAVLALFWALGRSRSTLVVAVSIPLTVVGTFVLMDFASLGINLMTLGALTVTIGMIDDDAVLVIENIVRHRQMGKDPGRATVDGTKEILGADVAGTLTTVAAFVPLVLLSGLSGRLFLPFGLTFSFVLLLSLLVSLTLIPWATARWLPPADRPFDPSQTTSGRVFAWLTRINGRLLAALLAHKAITIAGCVALLGGAIALLAFSPMRFLPLLDETSLLVSYQLPPGTSLGESDRVGHKLEGVFLKQPGVEAVFRRTGSPEGTFFIEGPDQGELVLRLDPHSGLSPNEIRTALEDKLALMPGLLTRINEPTSEKLEESFAGLPALFGITVFGSDLDQLFKAGRDVEAAARGVEGIENIVNNTKITVDSLQINIDRAAAARHGVTAAAIMDALETAMQGREATQSLVDGRVLRVFVRYAPEERRTAEDVAALLVPNSRGELIPLGAVAHLDRVQAYPSIEHQFGTRALTMTAEIEGNPFAVISSLDAAVAKLNLPADIHVGYTGQYQELAQTASQMIWILLGAAALVFGIMAVQLRSALDAAIVLIKLPIDFAGAALALVITGVELDLTVMIGFITLIGVAVNNGIVLLSFAGQLRREGHDLESAIQEAVRVRFRPMLLTHLTTLLALLPAAVGLGAGPQLLQPLGVMLFGGLTLGTIMTLNFIPVVYVGLHSWRRRAPH